MKYYRLVEPWSLRGYEDQLLLLERSGETSAPYTLTSALYSLLSRCDGTTPFDVDAEEQNTLDVLSRYQEKGVIAASATPSPLMPYQQYRHFANRRIPRAFWGITGRCNQRCIHCFMAADAKSAPSEFSYEQALHVIDEFASCGIRNVLLSGGEPLVHPDFARIAEAIAKKGLQITRLYTNGTLLNQGTIDLFRSLDMTPEIVVSFDGLGTHDWMRGVKNAEHTARRAIELSIKNELSVWATLNVNTVTMGRLIETCHHLCDLGVNGLFFIRTSEAPRWLAHRVETLTNADYCQIIVDVIRALRPQNKKGLSLKFFNSLDLTPNATADSVDRAYRVYVSEAIPESAWCGKCVNTLFLASDGRVLPCDAFEGATLMTDFLHSDNNIHERPLQAILTDSEYADTMQLSVEDMFTHNPECRTCAWHDKCHGGVCRACGVAAGAVETGNYQNIRRDIMRKTPVACTMFKDGYYEQVLTLLQETS
jgi:radical SAM protein with 4Fe4S-binding SPASM domain